MVSLMTWNVNSVRARQENIVDCLKKYTPDIVGLQEIKCLEEQFPREIFEDLGYNIEIVGQKSYHGVALLSKYRLCDTIKSLPHFTDEQARFISSEINLDSGMVQVINCYMPNGNPIGTEKYSYKLAWLAALDVYLTTLQTQKVPFLLCGDFNIIPTALDTHDEAAWQNDALYQPEVRAFYHKWRYQGLMDTIRCFHPQDPIYSFWDYQARAREKNHGIRIDHILASPLLADKVKTAFIIDEVRDAPKASDHIPVMVELDYS